MKQCLSKHHQSSLYNSVKDPVTLKKGHVTLIGAGSEVTYSLFKRNITLQGSK